MGQVNLKFKPSVPVFDANVALGRRHDRRVVVDTAAGTLDAMKKSGVERALVYSPHAGGFDTQVGNRLLVELIEGHPSLVPQFVANPATDDLEYFADTIRARGVRSVRMEPNKHNYPFRDWVVGPWLDWLEAEGIPLWTAADESDPSALHDTVAARPGLKVVLAEAHYSHVPWAIPLLRSLPNMSVEMSRFVIADGVARLLDTVGERRILFGSRFPDSSMGQQLYNLHRTGLDSPALAAICSGNLDRLLRID
jgi:predicted TIM-barrel fold metal-dependent hydrolase